MRRKERSRSPDRRDAKQRLLKPDTSEQDILSAVERRVLELKSQCLVSEQPHELYIEPFGYDSPLGATQPNRNTSLEAPDLPTRLLMTMAYDILESVNTDLLLMDDPGSGKTVFVKQLERKL
ncbi:hypothetical protein BGZ88_004571 [Linnemannia elongata]|nr:hypothetical protein BGZ88_004571 [Linnemannia elongata]